MGVASSRPPDAFPIRVCLAFPIEELLALDVVLRAVPLSDVEGLSGAAKIHTAVQRYHAHEREEELARRGTTGSLTASATAGAETGRL